MAGTPAIIGGQGQFVNVLPANGQYNAATDVFTFDMSVQNLLAQTMGTISGPVTGVRVFIVDITGNAQLDNEDGTDTFTETGQQFFLYNQALPRDQTSASRLWRFTNVTSTFTFFILIQAELSNTISNVQYCGTHPLQKLDVFYPDEDLHAPPRPVIVYIHGGAWWSGDKTTENEHVLFGPGRQELLDRGYVFVSINYRLAAHDEDEGGAVWPEQINDVKCAVRHLRNDALKYRIDPSRMGAWGHSAGGHLAALLGTTPGQLEGNDGYTGVSSAVHAVVPQGALLDLTHPEEVVCLGDRPPDCQDANIESAMPGYLAQDPITETYSPVFHADGNDPPFRLLHGEEDQYFRPNQSTRLFDALGGSPKHEIEIVAGAEHSFFIPDVVVPPGVVDRIADFFDTHLGS